MIPFGTHIAAAAIALGALLLVQTGRLHFEQEEHKELQAKVDRDVSRRPLPRLQIDMSEIVPQR